ncbi:MAG: putative DNA binding domain-containing protein [candidate division WOR-3 bacterium]|nr:putative DNA binding domain-containing protein [candidate division WOR-3 bacterium]
MDYEGLKRIVAQKEWDTLELKKSTAQIKPACETLCALLNGKGGHVLIGVKKDGEIIGQEISEKTLEGIANELAKIKLHNDVIMERITLETSARREVIVLEARPYGPHVPYTYDDRPYERIGNTARRMLRERYDQLLSKRRDTTHRWETQVAEGWSIEDLDTEEILRTARRGIETGRLPESTGSDPAEILERFDLMTDRGILNAAVVLFGREFLPDYPQCGLRMARFKGLSKIEFLDNRQIHAHAFQLLEEAMLFMRRHLPIAGNVSCSELRLRYS